MSPCCAREEPEALERLLRHLLRGRRFETKQPARRTLTGQSCQENVVMVISALSIVGRPRHRRGTVLPLVALTIVAQLSFLALAIDLGCWRSQRHRCNRLPTLPRSPPARSLEWIRRQATTTRVRATTNAQNALDLQPRSWGKQIQASQLQLTYGSYDYNQTTQTFPRQLPAHERLSRLPRSRPRSPRAACRPPSVKFSGRNSCRTSRRPPRRYTAPATSPW